MKKIPKLKKNNIDEYFSAWAIQAGEVIGKDAKRENWEEFDYISAINFMLNDVKNDVEAFLNEALK